MPEPRANLQRVGQASSTCRCGELRRLEDENRKLKQVVADLTLDNRALKDIATRNW